MRHYLFNGSETPEEIRRILSDNSEGKENYVYAKNLTEDELKEVRERYTDTAGAIAEHDEQLAEAKRIHKESTKELKAANKESLKTIRRKYVEVEENVWKLPNHESGFMEYVNDRGEVVGSRRLKPEEKQGHVFNMRKVAGE